MKRLEPDGKTLAAELDRTKWDYNAAKDRSFLLTSVLRTFASVAWEVKPQHLTPVQKNQPASVGVREPNEADTQPIDRALLDNR